MEIKDLQDKMNVDELTVRIIWDQCEPKEMFGKKIKSVIVADYDLAEGPTAYLDLINEQIEQFKHKDNIKITNAYSKKIPNKNQYRITNAKKMEKV